jgi:undecaprenyl diphosphate synthase
MQQLDNNRIPAHVAIIMDGNGRWAKAKGLPRTAGHIEGVTTAKKITEEATKLGIKYLTLYTFSTENWNRPKDEINALMALLEDYLDNGLMRLAGRSVRIHFIGDMNGFTESFRKKAAKMEEATQNNDGLFLNVALNYGSRSEITHAVKEIVKKIENGEISSNDISVTCRDVVFNTINGNII